MKAILILILFLASCAAMDRHYKPDVEVKKIETKHLDEIFDKL